MANAIHLSGYSASQIALIRQTVAKDCNESEFNLFFEAARAYGLDPFRKQISALVFNKDKADKRQLAIIVGRDGLRAIASRCGDYRPASEPAEWVTDPTLCSSVNPAGLVSCAVRLWKADRRGEWFPVHGEAYWEEFAPVKDEWAYSEGEGKRRPTGNKTVDGNWSRMPRVMLQKCAEAQALRAGWPEQFGGLYAEEELHRVEADMTATDAVEVEAQRSRMDKIGGKSAVTIGFDPTSGIMERVAVGQVADRCMAFLRDASPENVYRWHVQNRVGLQEFWAMAPNDALAIKKAVEPILARHAAGLKASEAA